MGGTLRLRRERLEPSACTGRSEDGGMKEAALARLSPRLGYESTCSEGSKVCVTGEVVQDFVDDVVWDYGDGNLWDSRDNILWG